MISRKKCKGIALSIFIKFTLIIQIIIWTAIICDNLRVFEPSNPNSKYEPIMKTIEARLSCDFKWSILVAAKLSCNFKIPTLVPIIAINVCLIIFILMPKSSLEYWKLAEVDLTYAVYLSTMTVSSLHLII